jgi:hypothetical protein
MTRILSASAVVAMAFNTVPAAAHMGSHVGFSGLDAAFHGFSHGLVPALICGALVLVSFTGLKLYKKRMKK